MRLVVQGHEVSAAVPVTWEEAVAILVLASHNSQEEQARQERQERQEQQDVDAQSAAERASALPAAHEYPRYRQVWIARLRCELLLLEGQMLSRTGRLDEAKVIALLLLHSPPPPVPYLTPVTRGKWCIFFPFLIRRGGGGDKKFAQFRNTFF